MRALYICDVLGTHDHSSPKNERCTRCLGRIFDAIEKKHWKWLKRLGQRPKKLNTEYFETSMVITGITLTQLIK